MLQCVARNALLVTVATDIATVIVSLVPRCYGEESTTCVRMRVILVLEIEF